MPNKEAILRFIEEHKIHLIAAGAVAALLVVIVMLLGLAGSRGDEEPAPRSVAPPATLIPPEEAFLPNERAGLLGLEEFRYREPRTPWEEELVEEYWNPARETAIEALSEEAAREIDELFEGVE